MLPLLLYPRHKGSSRVCYICRKIQGGGPVRGLLPGLRVPETETPQKWSRMVACILQRLGGSTGGTWTHTLQDGARRSRIAPPGLEAGTLVEYLFEPAGPRLHPALSSVRCWEWRIAVPCPPTTRRGLRNLRTGMYGWWPCSPVTVGGVVNIPKRTNKGDPYAALESYSNAQRFLGGNPSFNPKVEVKITKLRATWSRRKSRFKFGKHQNSW